MQCRHLKNKVYENTPSEIFGRTIFTVVVHQHCFYFVVQVNLDLSNSNFVFLNQDLFENIYVLNLKTGDLKKCLEFEIFPKSGVHCTK